MKTTKVGSLRFLAAGIVIAGAGALPLAASAQTLEDCATASPSNTACENTTTAPTSTAPSTTTVQTTAAPTTTVVVENTTVNRERTASVLNSSVTTGTGSGTQLAFTGGDAAGLAALGAGALALGGGLMAVRRRRNDS